MKAKIYHTILSVSLHWSRNDSPETNGIKYSSEYIYLVSLGIIIYQRKTYKYDINKDIGLCSYV